MPRPVAHAALIIGAALLFGACSATSDDAPRPIAQSGRGEQRVALIELDRLDPGNNHRDEMWPRGINLVASQQDVIRLKLDYAKADIQSLRVRDSVSGTELTPNITVRWREEGEVFLGTIGSPFPERIDIELDLIRFEDEVPARLGTRPMHVADLPNGIVRMQSITEGISRFEKESRSFARLTSTAPAPGWSTVYVQWTSNRRSPALTPVVVATDGTRYVVAESQRFSTLDPMGIYAVPLAPREIDGIDWRLYQRQVTARLRNVELPPRETPVMELTRFSIPYRPPGSPVHVMDYGTFTLTMEQHAINPAGDRLTRVPAGNQTGLTDIIVVVRGFGGIMRLAVDEPHHVRTTSGTADPRYWQTSTYGVVEATIGPPSEVYLDFAATASP